MKVISHVLRRRWVGRSAEPSSDSWPIKPLSATEARAIPNSDFVSPAFDRTANDNSPSRMVVILSTPRSGSTYLCELLHRAGFCTAHEYFQREQYLPLLAERWDCIDDGRVSWSRYVRALERHRTSGEGVLGVNVHGAHLRRFIAALPYFSAPTVAYLWLRRRDKLRQAVSFAIARQTERWSSNFEARAQANYDYDFIRRRLKMIHSHEDTIAAFLHARKLTHDVIDYEELVSNPRATVQTTLGVDIVETSTTDVHALRPQGNATNDAWVSRFANDILFGPDT